MYSIVGPQQAELPRSIAPQANVALCISVAFIRFARATERPNPGRKNQNAQSEKKPAGREKARATEVLNPRSGLQTPRQRQGGGSEGRLVGKTATGKNRAGLLELNHSRASRRKGHNVFPVQPLGSILRAESTIREV